jgi:hypothetical protein
MLDTKPQKNNLRRDLLNFSVILRMRRGIYSVYDSVILRKAFCVWVLGAGMNNVNSIYEHANTIISCSRMRLAAAEMCCTGRPIPAVDTWHTCTICAAAFRLSV